MVDMCLDCKQNTSNKHETRLVIEVLPFSTNVFKDKNFK